MNKLLKKEPLNGTVIKTQAKIIAVILVFFIFGLVAIVFQNFMQTKRSIINSYDGIFLQQALALDNSIGQVVEHIKIMQSTADAYLSEEIKTNKLSLNIDSLKKISKYDSSKKYHIYSKGKVIGHHHIISTIYSKGSINEKNDDYVKQVFLSLDLQTLQKSYQENHSNITLSYYISEDFFSEIYPAVPIEESIDKSISFDDFYQNMMECYQEGISSKNNPKKDFFWTDPYVDAVGNGMMVSCAVPIYIDNKYKGLVGADVLLNFISKYTDHMKLLPGTCAIIAKNRDVISAKNISYKKQSDIVKISNIMPNINFDLKKSIGNVKVIKNNENTIFYISLTNAPWTYILSIKNSLIISVVTNEQKELLIGLLILIVGIIIIFFLIYKKMIKPGIKAERELEVLNNELDKKVTERTKELKEREAYSKTLFEESKIPLVVMDHKTLLYTDCNNAAIAIYGVKSKDDILGKTPLDFSDKKQYNGSDSKDLAKYYIEQALKKGSIVFNWRHIRPSGEIWDGEVQLMSISYNGNTNIQFSLFDITNKLRAEKEKAKLEEQLSQSRKMDAIGQLAGGIAHDFNNMLGGIVGAAQLLNRSEKIQDEKNIKYIDIILSASKRAADLTAKLLAFGRKNNIQLANRDVHKILSDTVELLSKTLDKKITINCVKNATASIVLADRSELQNIFINLGINSSHAMPNGGRLSFETRNVIFSKKYCEISTFNITPGSFIEIKVRDTGSGIKEENIKKIFEPFFTTKEQGKGTGLGLAAVYGTVQKHNGTISVYSEVGVGTVFLISLPNIDGDAIDSSLKDEKIVLGSGKILLIDDEEIIRIIGAALLEEAGYEVVLAKNGKEAIDIFKEQKESIDLIITDMIMPEMNGRETFHKLREIDPNCKIILSSGFAKDEDLKELRELGLSGFIKKPFQDVELTKLLIKVLGEKV